MKNWLIVFFQGYSSVLGVLAPHTQEMRTDRYDIRPVCKDCNGVRPGSLLNMRNLPSAGLLKYGLDDD